MHAVNGIIDRIKGSTTNLEEMLNIDLAICSALTTTAQDIAMKEQEYAKALSETLEYGYKMTIKKAETIATDKTNGELPLAKRKFDVLSKLHTHVQARVQALLIVQKANG